MIHFRLLKMQLNKKYPEAYMSGKNLNTLFIQMKNISFLVAQMNTHQHDSLDDEEDDNLASLRVYKYPLFSIKFCFVFLCIETY
jgi:hypothetical protein